MAELALNAGNWKQQGRLIREEIYSLLDQLDAGDLAPKESLAICSQVRTRVKEFKRERDAMVGLIAEDSYFIDEIETEVFNKEEREVPSTVIGEIVMEKLKELDAVAYVRFASVYREFKDIDTFMDELKKVMK